MLWWLGVFLGLLLAVDSVGESVVHVLTGLCIALWCFPRAWRWITGSHLR